MCFEVTCVENGPVRPLMPLPCRLTSNPFRALPCIQCVALQSACIVLQGTC